MNEELLKRKSDPKYDEDLVNKRYVDNLMNFEASNHYIKLPDGTLICYSVIDLVKIKGARDYNVIVRLPYKFINNKYTVVTQLQDGGEYWSDVSLKISNKTTRNFTCKAHNKAVDDSTILIYGYIAIGKWK